MGDNRAHSELGASISKRWIACPGSVNATRGLEQTDNVHAQMGRAAHTLGEKCLLEGTDPWMYIGNIIDDIVVDDEMVSAVEVYVNLVRELIATADEHGIEEQFDLSSLNPPGDMFGTTDFWSYHFEVRTLRVVDYKNGSGVVVEVKGNPQLYYYALGAALKLGSRFPIDKVEITVVQPRAQHPDGVVRSETISYFELLEFAGELLDAARKTLPPDAPLKPGSHCRFCPASPICPAQRKQAQAIAQVAFADMPVNQPPSPATLPDEVFWDMYDKKHILQEWLHSLDVHALRLHELGHGAGSGHKLVEGRKGHRKWVDEEAAAQELQTAGLSEHDIYVDPILKSPAQIEKLLPKGQKKIIEAMVERKDGRAILVRDTDPRPALAIAPGDAFLALPPGAE